MIKIVDLIILNLEIFLMIFRSKIMTHTVIKKFI